MNALSFFALIALAIVFVLIFIPRPARPAQSQSSSLPARRRRPTRRQYQAAAQAEQQLNQAYLSESGSQVGKAESQFMSALALAREADHPYLISDALYGAARMLLRKNDGATAAAMIEQALALEAQWPDPKPVFADQMRRDLERARNMSAGNK